ncbi:hypothetical protein [uncultured Ferrovibrio sp.]|uniref:hypothetical protein n=1 Tax=uncultured Ferrovibrio sp. TaxID=1576913 RepID=UPI00261CB9DF|nr:hypothetical protein [uncultured Ferrovibrio sp.]
MVSSPMLLRAAIKDGARQLQLAFLVVVGFQGLTPPFGDLVIGHIRLHVPAEHVMAKRPYFRGGRSMGVRSEALLICIRYRQSSCKSGKRERRGFGRPGNVRGHLKIYRKSGEKPLNSIAVFVIHFG